LNIIVKCTYNCGEVIAYFSKIQPAENTTDDQLFFLSPGQHHLIFAGPHHMRMTRDFVATQSGDLTLKPAVKGRD